MSLFKARDRARVTLDLVSLQRGSRVLIRVSKGWQSRFDGLVGVVSADQGLGEKVYTTRVDIDGGSWTMWNADLQLIDPVTELGCIATRSTGA